MTTSNTVRALACVTVAALTTLTVSGCGATDSTAPASGGHYPVTVENCGADVTVEAAPERAVMLNGASITYLHALGVLDRVVAKAGPYPTGYYDDETRREVEAIPTLTDRVDDKGHLLLSKETLISQRPDLVLDSTDNLDRESLSAVGVPLVGQPAFCQEHPDTHLTFSDVARQMRLYGRLFDRRAQAERAVRRLSQRVRAVEDRASSIGRGRTAAFLYPTLGGSIEAYGAQSMTDSEMTAAGFRNVFGGVDQRVFEISSEQLLAKDPDVIVLLYNRGDPRAFEQVLRDLPASDRLRALRNGDVMSMLFNYAEPPTPLAVDGLEKIVDRFGPS